MRRTTTIAIAVAGLAAAVASEPLRAQTAPTPQPGANKAAEQKPAAPDAKQAKAAAVAAAQKAYDAGTKSFEAGKHKEAVSQLSTALAVGGLPSQQMAKALYYRGVANRKLNKPAQAMSDLTTAIWVSGGLSDADRAAAIENRQAAYREAGLGDMAPGDVPPNTGVAQPRAAPASSATAAATAAPQSAGSAAPSGPAVTTSPNPAPGLDIAEATPPPAAKPKPVARDEGVPNPFAQSNEPAAPPQPTLAAAPEPAPLPANPGNPSMIEKAGNSISEAGSNVGNFFSNMFKSSPPPPPAQPQTGLAQSSGAPEPQASASPVLTAANPDGTASAADGWAETTEVKSGKSTKVAVAVPPSAVSAPPAPFATTVSTGAIAPASPAAKSLSGKYQLQIAAVRSRSEAEALAEKVRLQHASDLGGRELVIDEAVIGNFGSFHRVRVGPYADAREPGKLCSTLIKAGFDCLVVTK